MLSGSPIIGSAGLLADQPDAAVVPDNYRYFATDTTTEYVQFGGSWYAISGSGGGGSTAREILLGGAVTVPGSSDNLLTFDTVVSGDTLVDQSDLSHPAIVDAGPYSISIVASPSAPMTAGDAYEVLLSLDASGENAPISGGATASAQEGFPKVPLTLAYYIPAAGTITVDVFNLTASTSYDFNLVSCVIQRIS